MSATEILTHFRRLSAAERRKVILGISKFFSNHHDQFPAQLIAEWEARAEQLRRHPETGIAWETIRAERKARRDRRRSCAEK